MSKAAGWISPIVVVGGRIAGVWELAGTDVAVSMFPGAEKPPVRTLQAEAVRVAQACGPGPLTARIA